MYYTYKQNQFYEKNERIFCSTTAAKAPHNFSEENFYCFIHFVSAARVNKSLTYGFVKLTMLCITGP